MYILKHLMKLVCIYTIYSKYMSSYLSITGFLFLSHPEFQTDRTISGRDCYIRGERPLYVPDVIAVNPSPFSSYIQEQQHIRLCCCAVQHETSSPNGGRASCEIHFSRGPFLSSLQIRIISNDGADISFVCKLTFAFPPPAFIVRKRSSGRAPAEFGETLRRSAN